MPVTLLTHFHRLQKRDHEERTPRARKDDGRTTKDHEGPRRTMEGPRGLHWLNQASSFCIMAGRSGPRLGPSIPFDLHVHDVTPPPAHHHQRHLVHESGFIRIFFFLSTWLLVGGSQAHHEPVSLSLGATIPRLAPFQVIIPPSFSIHCQSCLC